MAIHALKLLLTLLGAAAIAIATSIILMGVSTTGFFFESLYISLTGSTVAPTGDYSPTAESEIRFYAVLWFAYGVLVLRAAQDFETHESWVPWLAIVFFGGGCARLIAYYSAGAPHPVFTMLMVVELVLPVILLGLWSRARQKL